MSEILTPNKKGKLISVLQQEYKELNANLFSGKLDPENTISIQNAIRAVKTQIEYLSTKTGVVTGAEYSNAIDIIDQSKKARMARNAKGAIYMIGFIVAGIIVSIYLVKKMRGKP